MMLIAWFGGEGSVPNSLIEATACVQTTARVFEVDVPLSALPDVIAPLAWCPLEGENWAWEKKNTDCLSLQWVRSPSGWPCFHDGVAVCVVVCRVQHERFVPALVFAVAPRFRAFHLGERLVNQRNIA